MRNHPQQPLYMNGKMPGRSPPAASPSLFSAAAPLASATNGSGFAMNGQQQQQQQYSQWSNAYTGLGISECSLVERLRTVKLIEVCFRLGAVIAAGHGPVGTGRLRTGASGIAWRTVAVDRRRTTVGIGELVDAVVVAVFWVDRRR